MTGLRFGGGLRLSSSLSLMLFSLSDVADVQVLNEMNGIKIRERETKQQTTHVFLRFGGVTFFGGAFFVRTLFRTVYSSSSSCVAIQLITKCNRKLF